MHSHAFVSFLLVLFLLSSSTAFVFAIIVIVFLRAAHIYTRVKCFNWWWAEDGEGDRWWAASSKVLTIFIPPRNPTSPISTRHPSPPWTPSSVALYCYCWQYNGCSVAAAIAILYKNICNTPTQKLTNSLASHYPSYYKSEGDIWTIESG